MYFLLHTFYLNLYVNRNTFIKEKGLMKYKIENL